MFNINTPTSSETANALITLRQWPSAAWCTQWVKQDTQVIISEQALLDIWRNHDLIDELPARPLALMSEIALLREQHSDLADRDLPITVIQIADSRWVELTLECKPVMVWDEPCSN
jgi:hypothetical protein